MGLIQMRRGTAAEWSSQNPILAAGEPGFETDTGQLKIGNGAAAWNSLSYLVVASAAQTISITKNGDQDLTGDAWQDIVNLDAPTYAETGTVDTALGTWTCAVTDKYRVSYDATLLQYSGNNRDTAWMRMVLDGSLIKGSESTGYHRQNVHGYDDYSFARTIPITAGQVLKVQARNASTARLHRVLENSFVFEVERGF